MKTCSKCKEEKNESEFGKDANAKDGLCYYCKDCHNKRNRDWMKKNSSHYRKYSRDWANKNRFKQSLKKARYVAKQNGHVACLATEEHIKEAFDGKCTICGTPEIECNRKLHMDHDHETGIFRGWLCGHCNKALGLFKDSDEILMSAALYLENHETKNEG
ncbi:hypothetical protein LCGC14_1286630 [marine sediment metagenome]|uniref:Recombination endonuclease VII n=1 Tax=marine sediment metagenome TaxID=412755 RepID=A0A0F9LEK8_9ZZZZ